MNLSDKIKESLPSELWQLLTTAGEMGRQRGWGVYLVGGVVRDVLLGRPCLDLDIMVEGEAIKLAQCLTTEGIILHPRFGTAKIRYERWTVDLATCRSETYPYPGSLPVVRPGTISDDLFRRDFTVNAMAVHLSPPSPGELFDPYGGKADLERGLIRILHPNSFVDDATRILRALRYEQRLAFRLEDATLAYLIRHIPMLDTISGDRLRKELELILKEEHPPRVLRRADELGVLKSLSPSLRGEGWLGEKLALATSPTLRLCLLIYNLSPQECETFIKRFNFPKTTAQMLRQTLELKKIAPALFNLIPRSHMCALLKGFSSTAILANSIATSSPILSKRLELFLNRLRYIKPLLNGEDLKRLGIPEGPGIGMALQRLLEARLDGEVKTRQEEEKLVRRWLATDGLLPDQKGKEPAKDASKTNIPN